MLRRIWALIVKEFLAIWKDGQSRSVLIGPPIIQLLLFGYAATYDVNHISAAILNQDGGGAGRDLVARFTGAPAFGTLVYPERVEDFAGLIDRRDVLLVVHVGPTFSADLAAGRPATVQLIVDGRNSNTALVVLGYANAIVDAFGRDWIRANGLPPPPGRIVARAWYNPNLEGRWFFIPGLMALLGLVVTVTLTALSVARERELGTFEQLLVSPLRPSEILVGKSVPALVIGLTEGALIALLAVLWFGVPLKGSPFLLFLGLFVFVLAIVGMGLMISALSRTQQQAVFGTFLFTMPAVILSGFATPIENMPEWVQALTVVNPVRYFLVIVRGVFLQDMTAAAVLTQLWPMALIAVSTLTAAGWLFRHRLQ